jgi:outer membrane protein OmpA-like peptidoglycan-associated protein
MTDRAGSDDYNRLLSLRRAREVARMLGVKDVVVEGLGEDSPQFPNQLPEGRAANRTVIVELRSKAP